MKKILWNVKMVLCLFSVKQPLLVGVDAPVVL